MPFSRGGFSGGPLIILGATVLLLIYRIASGGGSLLVIGAIMTVQVTAMVWLLARTLMVRYRVAAAAATLTQLSVAAAATLTQLSVAAAATLTALVAAAAIFAALATAMLRSGLSAATIVLTVEGLYHAAAYSSLLAWFAASLSKNHEPVITRFARKMRPTMPISVVRYTRHVTIAWCVFFVAQLAISVALLAAAPEAVWSSFVSLWNLPLVVGMFLAEFGCRLVLFRQERRTGLIATLSGLWQARRQPGSHS